eukprot:3332932-Lingulodinium_polyedra.AAC.1
MVAALSQPIYTAHAAHARDCRAPEQVLSHYLQCSRGFYQEPLRETCSLLGDLQTLALLGFEME